MARNEYFTYQELKKIQDKIDALEQLQKGGTDLKQITSTEGTTAEQDLNNLKEEHRAVANILENDGFTEQEVTDAYLSGKDKFTELENMFDTLVREDLNFLKIFIGIEHKLVK